MANRKEVCFWSNVNNGQMLTYLTQRSIGTLTPAIFRQSIKSNFVQCLELSKNRDFESVHTAAINTLDVDQSESRYLLSGATDGSIAVHDLERVEVDNSNTRLFKLVCSVCSGNRDAHKRSIETVQWYPLDTGIFTSSGTDRLLKIWDANTLKTADEFAFNGIVHSHDMSPVATKHNLIAVGTDSSVIKLVDIRTGSASHSLRGHKEGAVRAVRWSNKDEFILATGGIDNFAILWDVRTAKGCLMKFHQHRGKKVSGFKRDTTHDGSVNGVQFSTNGLHLTTIGTDQHFYIWNTMTGKKVPIRYPPLSHIKKRSVKFCLTDGGKENFAFVPTGSCVTNFSTHSGGKVRRLYGHYNTVNCCIYHESGNQLISGGNDHKILVWTMKGDRDYDSFLEEERAQIKEKKGETEAPALTETMSHTMDTWSDDDVR